MFSARHRIRAHLVPCAALMAVGAIACDASDTSTALMDRNGNGICDESLSPPLVLPPQMRAPHEAATLSLELSALAEPPVRPRLALLFHLHPFADAMTPAYVEAYSMPLELPLPQTVSLELGELPDELAEFRERLREEHAALAGDPSLRAEDVPLLGTIILYDDRDGDKRVGLGSTYFDAPVPSEHAPAAEWDAYFAARADYYEQYGELSFFAISSPTDPANEIVAASELSVWIGTDPRHEASGYRLLRDERACEDLSESETCVVCWSHRSEASFGERHPLVIDWALAGDADS